MKKEKKEIEQTKTVYLKLEKSLYEITQSTANDNERSLSGEVKFALKKHLKEIGKL